MFSLGKKIVLLMFFMHVPMQGMKLPNNPLSIEDGWDGLATKAPYIVCNIANHLDFVSYYSLRFTCKAYTNSKVYANSEDKNLRLLQLIHDMDADAYTKAMVFFSESSAMKQLIYKNVGPDASEGCPYETRAIGRLLIINERLKQDELLNNPEWLVSWYQKAQQEKIFEAYKNDIQSLTSLSYGRAAIIRLILHQKGDINWQDEYGNTLLQYAKHPTHIQFLLGQEGIDVNKQNNKGETPLHRAILHPGRDIDRTRFDGICAFSWWLAQRLLENEKTNIYAKTKEGKTVVHYAADKDLHDKRPNGRYRDGDAPFSLILQLLKGLSRELPPTPICRPFDSVSKLNFFSALDNEGRPAIYYAVKSGNVKVVELLLDSYKEIVKAYEEHSKVQANPYAQYVIDKDGRTLLHIAALNHGKWIGQEIIESLLGDLLFSKELRLLKDKEGKTFLDYARERDILTKQFESKMVQDDGDKRPFSNSSYLHSLISIVYKHPEIAFFSGITLAGLLGWLLYKSRT